jgi:DNA-binding NarL/FixJ family response regulator
LVADDHEVLRKGIIAVLSAHPQWSICGEAGNGRETVRLALELKPDLVILDMEMPELSGIEVTQQIKQALPATEILIFTIHDEEYLITEVLRAGARGHVLKTDSAEELVSAVASLAEHMPSFSPRASEVLLDSLLRAESDEISALTRREREIVQLLAEGKSNKEVATQLRLSVKTVETHRAAIMRKLGFTSITELVRYAIRDKLIRP